VREFANTELSRVSDSTQAPNMKLYYGILTVSMMFEEYSRHDGFGMYGTIGALRPAAREFFFGCIWTAISENISEFTDTLRRWHPLVTSDNLQPYLLKNTLPNIVSFLHLISQSICHEHVRLLLFHKS
jgi:hypothetical protein